MPIPIRMLVMDKKRFDNGQGRRILPPFEYSEDLVYDGEWFCVSVYDLEGTEQSMFRCEADGRGSIFLDERITYNGELAFGRLCGFGTMSSEDDSTFMGSFENDLKNGEGVLEESDGDTYKGTFVCGERHGKGSQTYRNNTEVYSGDWENNMRTGNGTLKDSEGVQYVGQWEKDHFQGTGKIFDAQGSTVYSGHFHLGERHGHGEWKNADGTFYVGLYRNGFIHGQGKMSWTNGSVYEGSFVKSVMQGHGVMRTINGTVYTGAFSRGVKNGYGEQTSPDKRIYKGAFLDGQKHGMGMEHLSAQTVYHGEFCKGIPHGAGVLVSAEGKYVGTFRKGEMHGRGEMLGADGSNYVGEFRGGAKAGRGKLTSCTGIVYDAWWAADEAMIARIEMPEGGVYEGEVKHLLPHGIGTYREAKFAYTGQWRKGARNGNGCSYDYLKRRSMPQTLVTNKNVIESLVAYDGQWRDNLQDGLGTSMCSGLTFSMNWTAGKADGAARLFMGDEVFAMIRFSAGMLLSFDVPPEALTPVKMEGEESPAKVARTELHCSETLRRPRDDCKDAAYCSEVYRTFHDRAVGREVDWTTLGELAAQQTGSAVEVRAAPESRGRWLFQFWDEEEEDVLDLDNEDA